MRASAQDAPAIALDEVSVRFGDSVAVDRVSSTIRDGEWVGVVGANGAGKSTLVRSIAQLQRHRGVVRVEGLATERLSRRQRARLVAYVTQSPQMPAGMSVLEYLLLGRTPYISRFGVESSLDQRICLGVAARLDIASMTGRPLGSLSGGERQRVVLGRALAQEAPVLLLDEPTSALDMSRRVEVLELVDSLRRERPLTVVSVLHDLTLAGQFADRLLMMSAGRVVASGPPSQVLDQASLRRCFGPNLRTARLADGDLVVTPQRPPGPRVRAVPNDYPESETVHG